MTQASRADTPPPIDRLFDGDLVAGRGDADLLTRFAAGGDGEAFAALVARHGPIVRGACRSALRDPADVEDACQATFLILARRAGSIRVGGSLAPWLYRVARRVAARAAASARRRRVRERPGSDLDALAGPRDRAESLVDLLEAIDLLPDRYRRPLVLCDLEGLTQVEAARALRCGEATLRRRLAAARDRLRLRLAGRGDAAILLAAARIAPPSLPTIARGVAAPSASAQRLARQIGTLMTMTRIARTAALLAGLGTATAAVALHARTAPTAADNPAPPQRPTPNAMPTMPPAPPPVRWVHLTSDVHGETWADLDTGRQLQRDGKTVTLLETAAQDLYTFEGAGPIAKTKALWFRPTDKSGRAIPPAARVVTREVEPFAPTKATDQERRDARVFREQDFETVEGRDCLRVDLYARDALGAARIDSQTWYDRATRRPIRQRDRLQVGGQHKFGREFETVDYDYPDTGPADLAALGVPPGTPVVDRERGKPPWNWADLPAEVRDAITRQVEAIRRFPTDYRAVTAGWSRAFTLDNWSAPREFVDAWARSKTSDEHYYRIYGDGKKPRYFRADNQMVTDRSRPEEIDRITRPGYQGELPADRIVAWLPLEESFNILLGDGRRDFRLTRLLQGEGKPRRTQVHVSGGRGSYERFPSFVEDQWPLLRWNRSNMTPAPLGPDTPPGMVVIRVHQPHPSEFRCEFTLDPARDSIAVRQVEWSNNGKRWYQQRTRATRFAQLPGGSWYVAEWERRDGYRGTPDAPGDWALLDPDTRRVVVTPLRPDDFPPGIFDGEKFAEDARKAGAVIEVDH